MPPDVAYKCGLALYEIPYIFEVLPLSLPSVTESSNDDGSRVQLIILDEVPVFRSLYVHRPKLEITACQSASESCPFGKAA